MLNRKPALGKRGTSVVCRVSRLFHQISWWYFLRSIRSSLHSPKVDQFAQRVDAEGKLPHDSTQRRARCTMTRGTFIFACQILTSVQFLGVLWDWWRRCVLLWSRLDSPGKCHHTICSVRDKTVYCGNVRSLFPFIVTSMVLDFSAIYLDDQYSSVEIYNNIFYNVYQVSNYDSQMHFLKRQSLGSGAWRWPRQQFRTICWLTWTAVFTWWVRCPSNLFEILTKYGNSDARGLGQCGPQAIGSCVIILTKCRTLNVPGLPLSPKLATILNVRASILPKKDL